MLVSRGKYPKMVLIQIDDYLVVWNINGLFSISYMIYIYGMSSFPLTHVFQDGHIAPPTSYDLIGFVI